MIRVISAKRLVSAMDVSMTIIPDNQPEDCLRSQLKC